MLEAATTVRSATGLDGVEAWRRRHASHSRRTSERMFGVQSECMHPKVAKDMIPAKLAASQWGKAGWNNMMTELGRVQKLLLMTLRCPMLRLDEIKVKVISNSTIEK